MFDQSAYYKQRIGDKIKSIFNSVEEVQEYIKRVPGDKTEIDAGIKKLFIDLGELWGEAQNIGVQPKKGKDGGADKPSTPKTN